MHLKLACGRRLRPELDPRLCEDAEEVALRTKVSKLEAPSGLGRLPALLDAWA